MKISKNQLSLRGLRTFCSAARHQSFRLAAEELFVTASAVSHRIKSLEDEIGLPLFDRTNRTLVLTETGQALFSSVDPLVRQLDHVTAPYRGRSNRQALRISAQPFFASELFVPRLSEFTAQYPEIDIDIDTSEEGREVFAASADVSIRVYRNAPVNLESDFLFPLRVVPACSPELFEKIAGDGELSRAAFPIIMHSSRSGDWDRWSTSAGIEIPEPVNIIQLSSMVAVVRAAEQGLGVALVPLPLSQGRLKSGQLVRVYKHEAVAADNLYFAYRQEVAGTRSVQALRSWVLQTFKAAA